MEKKHHSRTLPHTGHVKNSDEGSPDFVVGQSFLECVVFLSSRHCFYFFPDMDRKNLCCACSAWSGFSVARTFFRPVYNTSTGSVSDRWYVMSRQKRFVSGNLVQKSSAKRFRPPESGPRRLRHHLFVVCRHFLFFIKRNTVAIKTRA